MGASSRSYDELINGNRRSQLRQLLLSWLPGQPLTKTGRRAQAPQKVEARSADRATGSPLSGRTGSRTTDAAAARTRNVPKRVTAIPCRAAIFLAGYSGACHSKAARNAALSATPFKGSPLLYICKRYLDRKGSFVWKVQRLK